MNTAIRAHRILAALTNYEKVDRESDRLSMFGNAGLGELIGCYRNPGPQTEMVGVFDHGLVWTGSGGLITLRFSEIAEASLVSGKESEGLLLTTRDGQQIQLPIKGQRGRFYDSMEMLRFVDRVMQDLKDGSPVGTVPT